MHGGVLAAAALLVSSNFVTQSELIDCEPETPSTPPSGFGRWRLYLMRPAAAFPLNRSQLTVYLSSFVLYAKKLPHKTSFPEQNAGPLTVNDYSTIKMTITVSSQITLSSASHQDTLRWPWPWS